MPTKWRSYCGHRYCDVTSPYLLWCKWLLWCFKFFLLHVGNPIILLFLCVDERLQRWVSSVPLAVTWLLGGAAIWRLRMLQMIMCCVYAVCKVVDQDMKFKTIVSVYRQLPNTSQQVALWFSLTLQTLVTLFSVIHYTQGQDARWLAHAIVVSGVVTWMKLTHIGPSEYQDGWLSSGWYTVSVCNQPTRSTQPYIPTGLLNRVPASAGVRAGMSPLLGGR